MNKTTEALKLAEETLWILEQHNSLYYGNSHNTVIEAQKALAAIREALADHSGDGNEMVYSKPSVFDGVCCGCSKKAADGYALYCVECWEKSNGDPFADAGKLIQPVKQEPVAFIGQGLLPITPEDLQKLRTCEPGMATLYDTPLYAAPVQPVKQEPVALNPANEDDMKFYRTIADNYKAALWRWQEVVSNAANNLGEMAGQAHTQQFCDAINAEVDKLFAMVAESTQPVKQEPVACPNLQPVINWLENGCDPKEAAKELRIYQERMNAAPLDAKAIRALKLVYDNSTSHDWPEDIWNAIVDALYEEHRKTMATAPQLLGG